ncbi:MAG: MoaD/ThiS family protein [Candidatus Hydrogenedentes bacterium]|jgi:molybdopterin converting factor small subunit|nr:MoaD/ThiS family protein [Candidatus Hydrogenedentota bacterium]
MSENGGITVTVQYFAVMKEESGLDEEQATTSASSALELFEELRARHGFSLDSSVVKVVLNEEFCDWDHSIAAGDVIVFVPPVAGG